MQLCVVFYTTYVFVWYGDRHLMCMKSCSCLIAAVGSLEANPVMWVDGVHFLRVFRQRCVRYTSIQGVSWLVDVTAGGDFLGLCDQKCSYKHVSDFGHLWSYEHFLIPVRALVWTASYRTSWWVMYSTWWLIFCVASIIFATWLAQFTTERQPVLRPAWYFRKPALSTDQFKLKVISGS